MPLYEYECPRTGRRFEVIQKFSDDPIKECPDCGEHADCAGESKRLLSAPAIRFKGSGWYVNDYGKGGQKPKQDDAGEGAKKDSKDAKEKKGAKSGSDSKTASSSASKKD